MDEITDYLGYEDYELDEYGLDDFDDEYGEDGKGEKNLICMMYPRDNGRLTFKQEGTTSGYLSKHCNAV